MFSKFGYQTLQSTERNAEAMSKIIENISNVKSIGYKKSNTSFVETLNGEISKQESKDFSQGPLRKTAEPFDLALNGTGFFEVELPSGQRAYTRAGRLRLNNEGELVTLQEGYKIIPLIEEIGKSKVELNKRDNAVGINIEISNPKLTIPSDLTPEIAEDGTIYGVDENTNEKTKIGRINVVSFNNPQGLQNLGGGFYLPTKLSGEVQEIDYGPNKNTQVKQGYLEFGNVSVAQEMINMSQMRNFISAQFKVLKVIDKLYEQVHYTISKSA